MVFLKFWSFLVKLFFFSPVCYSGVNPTTAGDFNATLSYLEEEIENEIEQQKIGKDSSATPTIKPSLHDVKNDSSKVNNIMMRNIVVSRPFSQEV